MCPISVCVRNALKQIRSVSGHFFFSTSTVLIVSKCSPGGALCAGTNAAKLLQKGRESIRNQQNPKKNCGQSRAEFRKAVCPGRKPS